MIFWERDTNGASLEWKKDGTCRTKRKAEHTGDIPSYWLPGEKVKIDVKEVPYNWLRGSVLRDGKKLYQWTAIDECTRMRFVYGFEEHTPENSVKFIAILRLLVWYRGNKYYCFLWFFTDFRLNCNWQIKPVMIKYSKCPNHGFWSKPVTGFITFL